VNSKNITLSNNKVQGFTENTTVKVDRIFQKTLKTNNNKGFNKSIKVSLNENK